MPEAYGACGTTRGKFLPWSWLSERMWRAHNYWVSTTRPDGRPHVMPVWGVWVEDRFYFSTDPNSRKGRNLAANPALAVHLGSGDEAVILEGVAREVTERSQRASVDDAYFAKYGMRLTGMPGPVGLYALELRTAFAWREKDFPASATRWVFGGD
ncbi:MAG: pyridoxamine 5'-phosphate oxidase family protein [bacterium]